MCNDFIARGKFVCPEAMEWHTPNKSENIRELQCQLSEEIKLLTCLEVIQIFWRKIFGQTTFHHHSQYLNFNCVSILLFLFFIFLQLQIFNVLRRKFILNLFYFWGFLFFQWKLWLKHKNPVIINSALADLTDSEKMIQIFIPDSRKN